MLTSQCDLEWQHHGGIARSDLPGAMSGGIHALVFNIHDRLLPGSPFSSEAHSDGEVACLGDLAALFDLVLFQEAFVRPAQLARYTGHPWAHYPVFSEGGGGDWWPLRLVCEICLSPGLLMLATDQPEWTYAEPYEAFAGWNTSSDKADHFFSKGFQLAQFPTFWSLNSHLDSGSGQRSREARALQLRQMTAALKRLVPPQAPLLIGMDSNLRPDRIPSEAEALQEFLAANGLRLVIQNGPDLIAVRSLSWEQPRVLELKGVLSDHNALSVIIYPPPPSESPGSDERATVRP